MSVNTSRWSGKLLALVSAGFIGVFAPLLVNAQLAPVAGAHYAKSSGTGFQGGANASGGFGSSVPMDLPAARGGLSVPVQVNYGGKKMGAAGLGWDVPLSFISRNNTTAYRRPRSSVEGESTPFVAGEQYSLTLDGAQIDLIRNTANTAWVARRGSSQIEVRSGTDGVMLMYDGEGRTYSFSSQSPLAGGRLVGGNLFLLRSITGSNGNRVELAYGITAPALSGGGTGLAINLNSVSYNLNPSVPNCFKHKVSLVYDAPVVSPSPPLAMSVLNGTVLARVQKLTAITVGSKATCNVSEQKLATYNFTYEADLDTRQPRLKTVTMNGQQGTAEQYTTLPIATYSYGSIVNPATNQIAYTELSTNGTPAGASTAGLSYTNVKQLYNSEGPVGGRFLETQQSLMDFNGDGRIDFSGTDNQIHINTSGSGGPVQFTATNKFLPGKPETYSNEIGFRNQRHQESNVNDIHTQHIDMNGDGRIDMVSAGVHSWSISLNVPQQDDPSKSVFVARSIPTAQIRQALLARGFSFDGVVPLARTSTVTELPINVCWSNRSDGSGGTRWIGSPVVGGELCGSVATPLANPRKKTIKEFELKDVNGDGYPDFVYNASRVNTTAPQPNYPAPPLIPTVHVMTSAPSDISGSRDILALINTAGVHFDSREELFSSPITLEEGGSSGCGLGRWEVDVTSGASGNRMAETCGLEDINGDGIADRVTTSANVTVAKLGTGDMSRPYANATITLPGPLARTITELRYEGGPITEPFTCVNTGDTYSTTGWAKLQDINGDGIPDYFDTSSVAIGTGTGFAAPVTITSHFGSQLPLMVERNQCNVAPTRLNPAVLSSGTPGGFYDIDGDGQPEIVAINAAQTAWQIFHLVKPTAQVEFNTGIMSVPAAGRLTKIDNGYGASTTIAYASAKEEWNTAHNVPFPEIVVSAVGKKDATNASLMSTTRHAYRGANMIFDPAYDAYRFPGYLRTVTVQNSGDASSPSDGIATITDSNGLELFNENTHNTAAARFKRYSKAGLTSAVTTLSGNVGTNPWDLLNVDINTDTRRTAATNYDWEVRLLPAGVAGTGNEHCLDMVVPYNYSLSLFLHETVPVDACTQHGFMFQKVAFSWRGTPGSANALTSPYTVQSSVTAEEVDDYSRVLRIRNDGDLFDDFDNDDATDDTDDTCTQITFASPRGTNERVLNAPLSQTTTNCGSPAIVLSESTWEYDTSADGVKLPGQVSKGFVTAHIVSRRNTTTGARINDANGKSDIRLFDIVYDSNGNPVTINKSRDDGATLTVNTSYDPFALVPVSVSTDATNADGSKPPAQTISSTLDAVTLRVLSSTDATGMVSSNTYDGFGRVLLSKVKPVGGTEGVLSRMTYNGFAVGQTTGRNIVQKVFTNPVPVANVGTAPGRTSTVFLDNLGRAHSTEVALGADYANKKMLVGKRTYDQLGRVKFEADPFPSTDSFSTAYGTTYHFNADGTPWATIRGYGEKPRTEVTVESTETYPTRYTRYFSGNAEILDMKSPDALKTGSPQFGIQHSTRMTALGRTIKRQTGDPASGNTESSSFSYDSLGQLASMTRYQDALASANPVTTRWTYDSLGQVIKLEEPGIAVQNRSYSNWGELTQVQWNDAGLGDRRNVMQYDALSRLTRSEDRTAGVVDAATVNTYLYDTGVNNAVPVVTATNVLGRLAKATSPTSTVAFSYDGLGRVDAKTFTDTSVSPAKVYVEKHEINGDGSLKTLRLLLPDNAFKIERIDYAYDSAGRNRSVKYSDGTNRDLFTTNGSSDIDVFGRIRQAQYGVNTLTANYADVGRRLLNSVRVTAPANKSREITFPTIAGVPAFDPAGRERVRRESRDGVQAAFDATSVYDNIGRLQTASLPYKTNPNSTLQDQRFYTYDALGNIVQQSSLTAGATANNVTLSYDSVDRDRICSVGYGTTTPPAVCNVKYDSVGNIVEMPTRANGPRYLTYFANGSTKSITQGTTIANYKYDAFGAVQQLELNSTTSADSRLDKHFGDMLTVRKENNVPVLTRKIAGPGLLATRHGPAGEWTFTFGEQRGNRFVTDQSGAFVQDMAYKPFGEEDTVLPRGELPGSMKYNNAQWNGGDALAALGISQLGARMYDPVIGRFLSRDPLILPRTSATTNPYSFAMNDPVNMSDPTGLDSESSNNTPIQCEGTCGGSSRGSGGIFGGGRGTAVSPTVSEENGVISITVTLPQLNQARMSSLPRSYFPTPITNGGAIDGGSAGGNSGGSGGSGDSSDVTLPCNGCDGKDEEIVVVGKSPREKVVAGAGVAGDVFDVTGWYAKMRFGSKAVGSKLIDAAGGAADYIGYANDLYNLVRDPSLSNAVDGAEGALDNALMAAGPPGWVARGAKDATKEFATKHVIPTAQYFMGTGKFQHNNAKSYAERAEAYIRYGR